MAFILDLTSPNNSAYSETVEGFLGNGGGAAEELPIPGSGEFKADVTVTTPKRTQTASRSFFVSGGGGNPNCE